VHIGATWRILKIDLCGGAGGGGDAAVAAITIATAAAEATMPSARLRYLPV